MFISRMFGIFAALVIIVAPVSAQAETCSSLRAELGANSFDMAGIAIDYPLTHFSIVACLANNDRREDAFACVIGVVAFACGAMGRDYCSDLTSRWARAGHNYWLVVSRMRELGCRI